MIQLGETHLVMFLDDSIRGISAARFHELSFLINVQYLHSRKMEAVKIANDQNATLDLRSSMEQNVEGIRQMGDPLNEVAVATESESESESEAAATEMTSPEPSNASLPIEVISYHLYEQSFNTQIYIYSCPFFCSLKQSAHHKPSRLSTDLVLLDFHVDINILFYVIKKR